MTCAPNCTVPQPVIVKGLYQKHKQNYQAKQSIRKMHKLVRARCVFSKFWSGGFSLRGYFTKV